MTRKSRRRKPELVHGLTETVELKDWDFAIIQAALKLYIKDAEKKGKTAAVGYAQQLRRKLRKPFVNLVKRTKREHRRLNCLLTHTKDLTAFLEAEGLGGNYEVADNNKGKENH